jgi:hypothetical protein
VAAPRFAAALRFAASLRFVAAPRFAAALRFAAAPVPERFVPAVLLRPAPLRAEADLPVLLRRVVDLGCGMGSPPVCSRDLPYPPNRDGSHWRAISR